MKAGLMLKIWAYDLNSYALTVVGARHPSSSKRQARCGKSDGCEPVFKSPRHAFNHYGVLVPVLEGAAADGQVTFVVSTYQQQWLL